MEKQIKIIIRDGVVESCLISKDLPADIKFEFVEVDKHREDHDEADAYADELYACPDFNSSQAEFADFAEDSRPSWADERMNELHEKGHENWDQDDWEAYAYIQQARYEGGDYDG